MDIVAQRYAPSFSRLFPSILALLHHLISLSFLYLSIKFQTIFYIITATQLATIFFPSFLTKLLQPASTLVQYISLVFIGIFAAILTSFLPSIVENALRMFLWVFIFPFFTFQVSKFWMDVFRRIDYMFRDFGNSTFAMLYSKIFVCSLLIFVVTSYLVVMVEITLTLWPVSSNSDFPNVYNNIKVMFPVAVLMSCLSGKKAVKNG